MSVLPEVPDPLVSIDLGEASVTLTVDAELVPLDALYGAAYVFIDRCYVFLEKPSASRYRVVLLARGAVETSAALRALVDEFSNELLACAWRHEVAEQNQMLIETVTMQALGTAMNRPTLDDQASFTDDDALDDPLHIAQSWEEKYARKSGGDDP
jgi:His-Xaa-Ser system protein HxsD